MSCRVLKRGLEDVMMNCLVSHAKDNMIKRIIGYYYPTVKNSMVKNFYAMMGFGLLSEDDDGNSVWNLEVESYKERDSQIAVEWFGNS